MSADPKPVAWSVVDENGKCSIFGWCGMEQYQTAVNMALLRPGHRFVFAIAREDHEAAMQAAAAVPEGMVLVQARDAHNLCRNVERNPDSNALMGIAALRVRALLTAAGVPNE